MRVCDLETPEFSLGEVVKSLNHRAYEDKINISVNTDGLHALVAQREIVLTDTDNNNWKLRVSGKPHPDSSFARVRKKKRIIRKQMLEVKGRRTQQKRKEILIKLASQQAVKDCQIYAQKIDGSGLVSKEFIEIRIGV